MAVAVTHGAAGTCSDFKQRSGWRLARRAAWWNAQPPMGERSGSSSSIANEHARARRRWARWRTWWRVRATTRLSTVAAVVVAAGAVVCVLLLLRGEAADDDDDAVYRAGCRRDGSGSAETAASDVISESTLLSARVNASLSAAHLVVLTHKRADSLLRLLRSLRAARYGAHAAHLHVWIDRAKTGGGRWGWLRRRLRVGGGVDEAVVRAASQFAWPHGDKRVHVWRRHVGIWGQWLDSYRPSAEAALDGREVAVILEDDLQVSAAFFEWLVLARRAYGRRRDIFGYSLQRAQLRANQSGFGRRALRVPSGEGAFLYPLLGTWGYSPVGSRWAQFRRWFHAKQCDATFRPYVDGLVPTRWYRRQERARSMWSMWHIYYAQRRGWNTVYANVAGGRTLAANWRETGLHFGRRRRQRRRRGGGAVTGVMDAPLAGSHGETVRFRLPAVPRQLAWNGTYVRRDGRRVG